MDCLGFGFKSIFVSQRGVILFRIISLEILLAAEWRASILREKQWHLEKSSPKKNEESKKKTFKMMKLKIITTIRKTEKRLPPRTEKSKMTHRDTFAEKKQ